MTDQGQLIPMTPEDVEVLASKLETAHRAYQIAEQDYQEALALRRQCRTAFGKLMAMWAEARWVARDGTLAQQQAFQQHISDDLSKPLGGEG